MCVIAHGYMFISKLTLQKKKYFWPRKKIEVHVLNHKRMKHYMKWWHQFRRKRFKFILMNMTVTLLNSQIKHSLETDHVTLRKVSGKRFPMRKFISQRYSLLLYNRWYFFRLMYCIMSTISSIDWVKMVILTYKSKRWTYLKIYFLGFDRYWGTSLRDFISLVNIVLSEGDLEIWNNNHWSVKVTISS